MRDCARLRAPNEITAAKARDAFQRRASLFLLLETEAIKALLAKNVIYLCRRTHTYTLPVSLCSLHRTSRRIFTADCVTVCGL